MAAGVVGVAEPSGTVGGAALVCCVALAGYTMWKTTGRAALTGVLFAAVGAWGLVDNHIYWPLGTLTMLCLGVGLWMLASRKPQPRVGIPQQAGRDERRSAG
ncbi:hypothetical protein ACNAW0_29530 [Micromonospora sp. SL1-18]|uniref:hypothetical protein n=1 Tax=Micromonospora sp. SL1-18 TaxID=3399128 RepID=UPI003A4E1935